MPEYPYIVTHSGLDSRGGFLEAVAQFADKERAVQFCEACKDDYNGVLRVHEI